MDRNGSGTNFVIYQKTPYIIYHFGKKVGQEKFISFLSEFYSIAQEKRRYFFSDFEKIVKNKVKEEDWQSFINDL
jgi:hypothetical protein